MLRAYGFSTGAIAKGDFRRAVSLIKESELDAIELSALRLSEIEPLVQALPLLDLKSFSFVSFHCPSSFGPENEDRIVQLLTQVTAMGIPIVVHPDVIFDFSKWSPLGSLLYIENMDKRKKVGRTCKELELLFDMLPAAGLCLDLAHARQVDPSLLELTLILTRFESRIRELHISELNSSSHHDPISYGAAMAYSDIAWLIPQDVPIIIESLIDEGQSTVAKEIQQTRRAIEGIVMSCSKS